ncbi:MAG TPA: hypothetical protein ENK18_25430 [Deltaproteobacteria bacterium]|nr:hypothetical protein [Deltaproteobacteria bacterium]
MQRTIPVLSAWLVACGGPSAGALTTAQIGAEGGRLSLGELSIEIPAGALDQQTEISISRDDQVEIELPGLTDVFDIEPSGLPLALPAEVYFEIEATSQASVRWSPDGDAWAVLDEAALGPELTARIDQLGWIYVAELPPE